MYSGIALGLVMGSLGAGVCVSDRNFPFHRRPYLGSLLILQVVGIVLLSLGK